MRGEIPRHPPRVGAIIPFQLRAGVPRWPIVKGSDDSQRLFSKEKKLRGQRFCRSTRIQKRFYATGVLSGGGLFQCE